VEHRCREWKTPDKEGAGGAHRGSRSPTRQFWRQRSSDVPTTTAAPVIDGGRLRLLQHRGRKARVRCTKIEVGVAWKPSSPQDGNGGGGSKSCGGDGSGDWRTAWASSKKALEGRGASVRGVPHERKESEGWRRWPFEGHGGSVVRAREGRGGGHVHVEGEGGGGLDLTRSGSSIEDSSARGGDGLVNRGGRWGASDAGRRGAGG
jgi:hypothetical protein